MDSDKGGQAKPPATTFIEITQPHTNSVHYGESPDLGSALKKHDLEKSVSPERARTPAPTDSTDLDSATKKEYTIYEQVISIEAHMSALKQRVLEIFAHAREDKYIMGSSQLYKRLIIHIQDEESLLALLRKSPTAAELAAHLLNAPEDSALAAWKEQGGGELKVDSAFIKEKIKDAQEEIAATRIALYINAQQHLKDASFRQLAP
jgi:hypothetical protein